MNGNEAVASWIYFRAKVSTEQEAAKQSQNVLNLLFDRYERLPPSDRILIDDHPARTLSSADEKERFDALAEIHGFQITSAISQVRSLAAHLESDTSPSAPYQWAKANRLIGRLSASEERDTWSDAEPSDHKPQTGGPETCLRSASTGVSAGGRPGADAPDLASATDSTRSWRAPALPRRPLRRASVVGDEQRWPGTALRGH